MRAKYVLYSLKTTTSPKYGIRSVMGGTVCVLIMSIFNGFRNLNKCRLKL